MENLTADKLDDMTPEQRVALFDDLVKARYGHLSTAIDARVSHDLGVTRATYHNWRRKETVPHMAILLLSAWQTQERPEIIAAAYRETAEALDHAAKGLTKALRLTGRL